MGGALNEELRHAAAVRPGRDLRHAFEQLGGPHRLAESREGVGRHQALVDHQAVHARQENHRRPGFASSRTDVLAQFDRRRAQALHIQKDGVKPGVRQGETRLVQGVADRGVERPPRHVFCHNLGARDIGVDQEHIQRPVDGALRLSLGLAAPTKIVANGEVKARAAAELARHANLAAHHLDQLA